MANDSPGRECPMLSDADDWRSPATDELFAAILALPDRPAAERFFRDLCTLRELRDLAQRWQVVQLLDAGLHYADISRLTGASTATITRIASWLNHGAGGYREALGRRRRGRPAARGGSTARTGSPARTASGARAAATPRGARR
jgi:TrpR-related protein YerC/YecD